MEEIVEKILKCHLITKLIVKQLWEGYGNIFRVTAESSPGETLIIKYIEPPNAADDSPVTNFNHNQKMKSYQVENKFYQMCPSDIHHCKIPKYLGSDFSSLDRFVIILEDLDTVGYSGRHYNRCNLSFSEVIPMIKWLAAFHATFFNMDVNGLWDVGSYWNLSKRKAELSNIKVETLLEADIVKYATNFDNRLNNCQFQTLIHGDAKVENFCFGETEVAGCDFQWTGRGPGVKDLYMMISSCIEDESIIEEILDTYFAYLHEYLPNFDQFKSLEKEWRELWPFVIVDFERFVLGWQPNHWKRTVYTARQSSIACEIVKNSS